jgi:hypothetical protein
MAPIALVFATPAGAAVLQEGIYTGQTSFALGIQPGQNYKIYLRFDKPATFGLLSYKIDYGYQVCFNGECQTAGDSINFNDGHGGTDFFLNINAPSIGEVRNGNREVISVRDGKGGFFADFAPEAGEVRFVLSDTPFAVPEPASWALMVGGFGMLGTSMRRRQRITVSHA